MPADGIIIQTEDLWKTYDMGDHVLAKLHDNVTVKVPLIPDGIRACRSLSQEGIKVNVTLCFSASQALLAAKSGATYISPFVGRLDDV